MINAWDLPQAADGRTPSPMTVEFQLRRLNRIASALWDLRPQIGEDPGIRLSIDLDSDYSQIHLSFGDSADRAVAEQLAGRLGWDVEADVRRVGMTKQHWWYGMLGGFRTQLVWIEGPEVVDTQGREQLPADVGVGNAAADAEHVRLQGIARASIEEMALVSEGHAVGAFRTEGPGQ